LFAALLEVCLAIQAFTACLHYDDLVERLQLYNELAYLAEIYPGKVIQGSIKVNSGQLRTIWADVVIVVV